MRKYNKPATTWQRTARKRNYSKYRLLGVKENLKQMRRDGQLLQTERASLRMVDRVITSLLQDWDERSERMGLKVRKRR